MKVNCAVYSESFYRINLKVCFRVLTDVSSKATRKSLLSLYELFTHVEVMLIASMSSVLAWDQKNSLQRNFMVIDSL